MCVAVIFLGGAAECVMSQWASSYLEKAISIPKVLGDVLGVALFALMLGLGRTLYSKFGKNIYKALTLGSLGAAICYVTAAITNLPAVALVACMLTGLCVSMLWPGSLIVSADRFEKSGVFIYAMMAAGGDLGAASAPQLVGIVADTAMKSEYFIELSLRLGISSEQLGMKLGMLIGALFPLVAVPIILKLKSKAKK